MEKEQIIEEIKRGRTIQLSSNLTKTATIVGLIIFFLADYLILKNLNDAKGNVYIILALLLVINLLLIFQSLYSAEATLKGKEINLKKLFRSNVEINVDSIIKIRSFSLKSTKYSIIKYTLDNKQKIALILNSNSIIFGEEISAGDIIKLSKDL